VPWRARAKGRGRKLKSGWPIRWAMSGVGLFIRPRMPTIFTYRRKLREECIQEFSREPVKACCCAELGRARQHWEVANTEGKRDPTSPQSSTKGPRSWPESIATLAQQGGFRWLEAGLTEWLGVSAGERWRKNVGWPITPRPRPCPIFGWPPTPLAHPNPDGQ